MRTPATRTTPRIRLTTERTSVSNCSRRGTSYTSALRRWSAPQRPTRVWLSSLGRSVEDSLPYPDLTENRTPSPIRTTRTVGKYGLACQVPKRSWDVVQLGNCGSPIETEAGWLVLTHGVGPMRTYSIGAILLDLEDPTRIIGGLAQPLLSPTATSRMATCPMWSIPAAPSCMRVL